jgi:hypothetical protein
MFAVMLRFIVSTRARAPVRLHGALLVHAVPLPVGEAYTVTGLAARAGIEVRAAAARHVAATRAMRSNDFTGPYLSCQ